MIILALSVAGAAIGALGLYAGLQARRRATEVVRECAEMMRQHLQTKSSVTDDRAVRDVAIVHYDALKEAAGGLSFSLALLNAVGDGVVITSINGRTETRTYAKVVQHGRSLELLSPEEDHAVRAARLGQGPSIRLDDPVELRANGSRTP